MSSNSDYVQVQSRNNFNTQLVKYLPEKFLLELIDGSETLVAKVYDLRSIIRDQYECDTHEECWEINGTISKDHSIQLYPRLQSSTALMFVKILVKS